MARLNTPVRTPAKRTHEGAPATRVSHEQQLRRSVLSCFLWEDSFYENGQGIAERIKENAAKCSPEYVSALAKEARNQFKLRHAPIWLMQSLLGRQGMKARAIADAIERPDEIAEFVAMYWKNGKRPLTNQMKKGLGMAFNKFDEYQLAKWNRKGKVMLRDVLFMVHAKPKDAKQAEIFKRLANNDLAIPKTRETMLSSGQGAKATYSELLSENKLGYMALLKNLRTMLAEGVDKSLIKQRLAQGAEKSKALPFRFLTAAAYAPQLEDELDQAMLKAFKGLPKLKGTTTVLVDCSGSMTGKVSSKSEVTRIQAAAALAVYAREASEDCRVFAFGTTCAEVPNRRGIALVDAILDVNGYARNKEQDHGRAFQIQRSNGGVGHGTNIGGALQYVERQVGVHDRTIVITDMQSQDSIGKLGAKQGYMLNVASYRNGVSAKGMIHIDGFSEQTMRYIVELEKDQLKLDS